MHKYIGMDLGGTGIKIGLVDENGNILARKTTPTRSEREEDAIIADIAKTMFDLLAECGCTLEEITSVGIGCPGAVDATAGRVTAANNMNFQDTALIQKLSARIQKPIYLENDANCAALAEATVGAAKGARDLVMLTLGTGVGSALILNGQLYSGSNHFGGELGHTIVEANGEPCVCGSAGCLEAYVSATALIRDSKRAAVENRSSLLWSCAENEGAFSGKTAFDAAKMGDITAQRVVDRYVFYLAVGLVNIIRIFQPEVIVVGGGVSNAGDALFLPLARTVEEMIRYDGVPKEKQTRIKVAERGNDAGIIGAAFLGKKYKA